MFVPGALEEFLRKIEIELTNSKLFLYTTTSKPDLGLQIVKTYHVDKKVFLDINVNRPYVVTNSVVLKFFINMCPTFFNFFVILKTFFQARDYKKFKFYHLQLLAIHYLQHEYPNDVPQLRDMMVSHHGHGNWSWTFNPVEIQKTLAVSLECLLSNFFNFVCQLKFKDQCLLVKDAISVEARCMQDTVLLPFTQDELALKLRRFTVPPFCINKHISIQDFLNLNINVTRFVPLSSIESLQEDCNMASQQMTERKSLSYIINFKKGSN